MELDTLRVAEQLADEALREASAPLEPAATAHGFARLRRLVSQLENGAGARVQQVGARAVLMTVRALSNVVGRLSSELASVGDRVHALEQRLSGDSGLDADSYLAFEDRFRGSSQETTQRLRVYLPYLEDLRAKLSGERVVEIGTGRGEMAELVMAQGFEYQGADVSDAMVRRSKERGINVVLGDGVDFLRIQPDRSLAAVISIHVIEHLPISRLVELVKLAFARLKPGGLLILETPHLLSLTASMSFFMDPTHVRPIHPALLDFLATQEGFEVLRCQGQVEFERLEQLPEEAPGAALMNRNLEKINSLLFGGQDLGFVARRPFHS